MITLKSRKSLENPIAYGGRVPHERLMIRSTYLVGSSVPRSGGIPPGRHTAHHRFENPPLIWTLLGSTPSRMTMFEGNCSGRLGTRLMTSPNGTRSRIGGDGGSKDHMRVIGRAHGCFGKFWSRIDQSSCV